MGDNGYFGNIQGPFEAGEELINVIQEDCSKPVNYISKIGIHFAGTYDLIVAAEGSNSATPPLFIELNNISFQIGKTRMLELEDVAITSIVLPQDVDENFYIDYQYK